MHMNSLSSLPDDLLHGIADCFDTANHVANFEAVCRGTRRFTQHSGWHSFVQTKFPSLSVPSLSGSASWKDVANRLTYIDRCYAKRGFVIDTYEDVAFQQRRGTRTQYRSGQSVSFQPVLDASLLPTTLQELLVVGAGEDLLARRKLAFGVFHNEGWSKAAGHDEGYSPGTGDITAVCILSGYSAPEVVVVGRANGDLHMRSLDDGGWTRDSLLLQPLATEDFSSPPNLSKTSLSRSAITSIDWSPENELLAAAHGASLKIYNLTSNDEYEGPGLCPIAIYDAARRFGDDAPPMLRKCKFLSDHLIAFGLGNSTEPLRWGNITPTGIDLEPARKSVASLDISSSVVESGNGALGAPVTTTVRTIERVDRNLILGAWDDGTCKLTDIRTPLESDVIYRDRWQPYHGRSTLAVFGLERFVAGSAVDVSLTFFDFRNPAKSYFHTDMLPCSEAAPTPEPPFCYTGLSSLKRAPGHACEPARCQPQRGQWCRWHTEMRKDSWRPDATLQLPSDDYIFSMAKVSDITGTLYCGYRGKVMEMTPKLFEDACKTQHSPPKPPAGWRTSRPADLATFMLEIGVSESSRSAWQQDEVIEVPKPFYHQHPALNRFPHHVAQDHQDWRLDDAWLTWDERDKATSSRLKSRPQRGPTRRI